MRADELYGDGYAGGGSGDDSWILPTIVLCCVAVHVIVGLLEWGFPRGLCPWYAKRSFEDGLDEVSKKHGDWNHPEVVAYLEARKPRDLGW